MRWPFLLYISSLLLSVTCLESQCNEDACIPAATISGEKHFAIREATDDNSTDLLAIFLGVGLGLGLGMPICFLCIALTALGIWQSGMLSAGGQAWADTAARRLIVFLKRFGPPASRYSYELKAPEIKLLRHPINWLVVHLVHKIEHYAAPKFSDGVAMQPFSPVYPPLPMGYPSYILVQPPSTPYF